LESKTIKVIKSLIIDEPLGYGEKYIQDLSDSENRLKYIAIEAQEELNEDNNGHTILKNEAVKGIKDMRRK
jgi:hypothetical protein